MSDTRLILSRRVVIAGLLAAPGFSHAELEQDAKSLLEKALTRIDLPAQPARLELIRFEQGRQDHQLHMEAVIQMTWSPGFRRHRIEADGSDPAEAVDNIVQKIEKKLSGTT